MFSKTITTAVIALVFAAQAHAHAAVSPVLGVAGTPVRGDVKRPLTLGFIKKPCGLGVNIAANLDTSTPVVAQPDGTFNVTVTNFNLGIDGSRKMSLLVDPTGTGKNMVAGTISTNGDPAPGDLSSEVLAASLPAGMTCTGGASGNLCLASFKSTFGFGNCVVIQQSPSTASNSTAATTAATTSAAGTSVAADPTTASGASPLASDSTSAAVDGTTADAGVTGSAASTTGVTNNVVTSTGDGIEHNASPSAVDAVEPPTKNNNKTTKAANQQAGTRAPRALLAGIPGEQLTKRNFMNWVWA